jgi:hypothetical protein
MLKATFLRFRYFRPFSRFQNLAAGTSVNDKQQKIWLTLVQCIGSPLGDAKDIFPNPGLDSVQNNFRMRRVSSSYSCLSRWFTRLHVYHPKIRLYPEQFQPLAMTVFCNLRIVVPVFMWNCSHINFIWYFVSQGQSRWRSNRQYFAACTGHSAFFIIASLFCESGSYITSLAFTDYVRQPVMVKN